VRYVAVKTFVDPTDGQLVEAGRTYVAASADCLRMFPRRFKKITRAEDFGSPDLVTRIGAPTSFGRASSTRMPAKMRSTALRPYWQLQREPWRLT